MRSTTTTRQRLWRKVHVQYGIVNNRHVFVRLEIIPYGYEVDKKNYNKRRSIIVQLSWVTRVVQVQSVKIYSFAWCVVVFYIQKSLHVETDAQITHICNVLCDSGVTRVGDTRTPGFLKIWRPFLLIAVTIPIAFYCFHSDVVSLQGVTPHLFYLSDLVSPLFFVNLPTFLFLRVSPPGWCHRGGPPPPP